MFMKSTKIILIGCLLLSNQETQTASYVHSSAKKVSSFASNYPFLTTMVGLGVPFSIDSYRWAENMLEAGHNLSDLSFTRYCKDRAHCLAQMVRSVNAKHPRLTKVTVLGTALFGGYLLYQWFQQRQQHQRLLFRIVGNETQQTPRAVQIAGLLHDNTSLPYELIKLAGEYDCEFRGYQSNNFSDPQELWRSNHGWQFGCKKLSDTCFICKGSNNTLQIWDITKKQCVETLRHDGAQLSAFAVIEKTETNPVKIVTASKQDIKIWQASEETRKWECGKSYTFVPQCTPKDLIDLKNGKIACRACEDGHVVNSQNSLYIFNVAAGTWEKSWKVETQPIIIMDDMPPLDRVVDLIALPHNRVAICTESFLRIYDSATKTPLYLLEQFSYLSRGLFRLSDGPHLLALAYGKKLAYVSTTIRSGEILSSIKIFDTETGLLLRELAGHTEGKEIMALGESPDGNLVSVIGSIGENIDFMRVWDVDTGNCIKTINCDMPLLSKQLSLITFPRHLGVPWWNHFVLLE